MQGDECLVLFEGIITSIFIEPGVKNRIGELMLVAKRFYWQTAFFPQVDQIKLLLFGSPNRRFSLRFVHIN
jgi:hypothetical protein